MNIDVFCSCQMPATYGDIVQCGLCEQWFHIKCVGLHSLPSIVQKNGIVHSVHKSRCVKMNFTFTEYLSEPAAAGSI